MSGPRAEVEEDEVAWPPGLEGDEDEDDVVETQAALTEEGADTAPSKPEALEADPDTTGE